VATLLPETEYGPDDTLLSVEAKHERAEDVLDEVAGQDLPQVQTLRLRVEHLARLKQSFEAWRELVGGPGAPAASGETLTQLVRAGNYRRAIDLLDQFAPRVLPAGPDNPVSALVRGERRTLTLASRDAWLALEQQVRGALPPDLVSWVDVHRGFAERSDDGFVLDGEAKTGVPLAQELHGAAQSVLTEVMKFETSWSPRNVDELLRARQAGRLVERLEAARSGVEALIARVWSGDAALWRSTAGVQALAAPRLKAVVDGALRAAEEHVAGRIEQATTWRGQGRAPEAVADLDELELDLFNAGLRRLSDDVRAVRRKLEAELTGAEALSKKTWDALFAAWLADLAALDASTPASLRARLAISPQQRAQLGPRLERLAEFAAVPDQVERLYGLAMDALDQRRVDRRPLVPALRAGPAAGTERGWKIASVDRAKHRFLVARDGAHREPVERSLFDLAPAQIVELASATGGADAALARALGALAVLPSRDAALAPKADLVAVQAAYAAVRAALEGLGSAPAPLLEHVREVEQAVDAQRRVAEETAFRLHTESMSHLGRKKYSSAKKAIEFVLGDPRLNVTKYARDNEEKLKEVLAYAQKELGRENMGNWLSGVQAAEMLDRSWELLYDFDTPEQLDETNFIAGRGVLEPFDGPQVVTPSPGANLRLHLRRGMDEPEDDVPLTWRSIFDPAERIEVSFDLYTLNRPYLLAVDVDGLQVADLCLDPAWFPELRAPEGLPLLPGERRAPPLLGFGRGRGVAFHEGADFGDFAAWRESARESAWPEGGRGERLAAGETPVPNAGELFGFEPAGLRPGQPVVRVKVVRERARLALFVDDREVASREKPEWARRGTGSERVPGMSGGSGAIRIHTLTPLAIDNLRLRGTVRAGWLAEQQKRESRPDR
jgi:DNA-binding protein H-NS